MCGSNRPQALDDASARCHPSRMADALAIRSEPKLFPMGSGLALLGALMMLVGSWGPWIGGKFFHATSGIDLGGDGWLVVSAAVLALLPLFVPLPHSPLKAIWVVGLAAGAAWVCWIHYQEANADGFNVVWGLELSGVGCGLLLAAGLRLLKP